MKTIQSSWDSNEESSIAHSNGRLFASLLSVRSFRKLVHEFLARLECIKETVSAEKRILRKNDRRFAVLIIIACIFQR